MDGRGVFALKIQVDSRIGSKHLATPLEKLCKTDRTIEHSVEMCYLDAADVAFEALDNNGQPIKIGVEICRINDLLQKVESMRLVEEQIPKLLPQYKIVYLVVEGRWLAREDGFLDIFGGEIGWKGWKPAKWRASGFKYKSVNNFLLSMASFPRLLVFRTNDDKETVQWIKSTADWWSKPWSEHSSFQAWSGIDLFGSVLAVKKATLVEKVAALLPNIGQKKVKIVANKFGSVKAMINSAVSDWIGIKTAKGAGRINEEQAAEIVAAIEENTNG